MRPTIQDCTQGVDTLKKAHDDLMSKVIKDPVSCKPFDEKLESLAKQAKQ